jgi:hypothetical protein
VALEELVIMLAIVNESAPLQSPLESITS